MNIINRREWLADLCGVGAICWLAGCGPAEGMAPPNERRATAPKSEPPPGMKPQEKFDPRKRLREKGAAGDPKS